jgi:cytochrome c556
MKCTVKWLCLGIAWAALSGLGWALKDDIPGVDEIMEITHKVKKGLKDVIEAEAKKPKPDWAKLEKDAKEFTRLIGLMEKNDPPKGPKASWVKLCKEYTQDVAQVEAAVKKKDAKAVLAAIKALDKKCDDCHDKHRP